MVKALKWIAYITIAAAFIGGIVAGNIFGPEPEFSYDDKGFAWGLMIMTWVAGGISSIFVLGFAALLQHIEYMSERLYNMEELMRRQKEVTEHGFSQFSQSS
ncbi:hypothetical protein HQN87_19900 [Paenibacillus tritici]|uniref:Uncharacterized protein n=1 Tax=Paenibacillus tritici TaxID=1873425 RepID=A0ABX2DSC5_9BACL|nr:hypothetical protein [Paenibacillus tritici]NQX47589.1 hypothetical protein [Paenibacillus tritici]QUL52380.1 hypothetical protein KDC22_18140 [Paenibacillus tritici]